VIFTFSSFLGLVHFGRQNASRESTNGAETQPDARTNQTEPFDGRDSGKKGSHKRQSEYAERNARNTVEQFDAY
jgi:hypothetical protein